MTKRTYFPAILAVLALCTLSFGQTVNYNYDQGTDFTKFKTYKWVEIKGSTHPDQLIEGQIKSAIESQLATKGLTKTDSDKADLYIGYQIGVDQEKQINAYNMGGGAWGYGGRWGGGMGTATTSTINIGQLVIDMYDPAAKKLVWRGTGTKEINPTAKPDQRTKNLNKGVEKMLKNYPPKKK
ncbi:MAG: DUF4136 domain-containing protein [Bryobacter sp.]|nr:DUF4136 domain-containing protein [Bryobacter sp.]